MKRWFLMVAVAGSFVLGACSSGTPVKVTHPSIPSLNSSVSASIDAVEIDQKAHRMYVADRTDGGVDVLDITTTPAIYLQTIATPAAPSGLAVAPDLGKVFVGISDGTVAVIDTKAGTIIDKVTTGSKYVDLLDYSAADHRVYAAGDGAIASIDASTDELKGSLKVGKALEQPRYNPADHMLYVTSPEAGALFQLDPISGAIKQKILLTGCGPKGMAINPKLDQALIACNTWTLRVNLRNPSDQHGFTQVGGGDLVSYDAAVDRFFVASPDAKPSEVGIFGGNPIDYVTAVETGGFGNAAAYDETNHMVYTPDVMPGAGGLAAFTLPSGDLMIQISPWTVAGIAAVVVAGLVMLYVVGKGADPVLRPTPAPPRRTNVETGPVRAGARSWTRPE